MKRIIIPSFVILSLAFLIPSCYYDHEDLLYGNGPCTDSTGTISYQQKVVPIFSQSCYTCHTGAFPSGNIVMGNYTADKALAVNGKLYGSISHSSGFSAMPKDKPALTPCQVAVIKKWIDSGMLNN